MGFKIFDIPNDEITFVLPDKYKTRQQHKVYRRQRRGNMWKLQSRPSRKSSEMMKAKTSAFPKYQQKIIKKIQRLLEKKYWTTGTAHFTKIKVKLLRSQITTPLPINLVFNMNPIYNTNNTITKGK